MKVFIKKETNIIDVPEENFAVLSEVTSNGYFKYDIVYKVDPQKAIANSAILVRIQATTKPPVRRSLGLFNGASPDQVIRNIQTKNSVTKDHGRSQALNVFFTYLSDLSAKIPNNKTSILSGVTPLQAGAGIILSRNKTVKLKPVSEITSSDVIMPVLENNISGRLLPIGSTRNAAITRAVSKNLVLQSRIDPANISGQRSNTIQSARKVSGGMISSPAQVSSGINARQQIAMVGDLLNSNNPTTHNQLKNNDFVNVVVTQPRTTIDVKEVLEIPIGSLQADEFFLVLTLLDTAGVQVQTINISVPHSKNVAALRLPVKAPEISVSQTGQPGKNTIQVKQVDQNATGISLYRKEVKKSTQARDAAYTFIANIETTKDAGFKRIQDLVNNYNPIIYRAIPYNSDKILGAEFGSAVAPAVKMSKISRHENFVSITGTVVDDGISLEIRDIPSGVIAVTIFKKDLTSSSGKTTMVTNSFLITNEETQSPIFALDGDVKKNRIYKYFCELLFRTGAKENSASELVIDFNPTTSNIVSTTLVNPEVVQTGSDVDIKFQIQSSLSLTDADSVKKALEDQGLSDFYSTAVGLEANKLQNIISYGVHRTNLTTGEVEDFGTVNDTSFSDKQFGKVKSVKSPLPGFDYKYTVTTFFRSAETTLQNATRTVSSSLGRTYVLNPSKWLHPITLKYGNLVSQGSLKKNHSKNVFSIGTVGNIANVNINLSDISPMVVESKVQKLGKGLNLIQWRVQGNVKKIDHFIITLETLGMKTIIGKCHNISDTNFFQFVDPLEDGEHGKIGYTVVPVFFDYSRGTENYTNEVIV